MAQFRQAPLPFVGQKRMFLMHFARVLNNNIEGDGKGWTIIDVFGGSGLLAHTAKQLKPQARVIYNDFDGYSERLQHIDDTNRLRRTLLNIAGDAPRTKRFDADKKMQIIQAIQTFDGYIDLGTVASWLLFSGQQVSSLTELFQRSLWHGIRQTDYLSATGYLDNLEIISESFHTLLPRFHTQKNVLMLLDPPYLCTRQDSYKQENYFDLIDFLQLIHLTKPPYIFFSSTKSEFIRFIEFMLKERKDNWKVFENAERITLQAGLNYQSKYEDNLVYKF